MSALQRTAQVQWLREGATLPSSTTAEGTLDHWDDIAVSSVYELMEHPDFSYRLGDVVHNPHPHSNPNPNPIPYPYPYPRKSRSGDASRFAVTLSPRAS